MNPRPHPWPGRGRRTVFALIGLIVLSLGGISAGPRPPLTPTPQPTASLNAAQLLPPAAISPASAIDAYHLLAPDQGWLLRDNHLYQTQMGGQTWTDITPDVAGYQIRAVTFLDTQSGWLALTNSPAEGQLIFALARTADGGHTWQQHALPLFAPNEVQALASAIYLQFLDSQTGWLVVKQATSSNFSLGTLFRTSDGGTTWTRLPLPIGDPVRFVTAEVGWTAGGAAGAALYRTLDGGQTWSPLTPNSVSSPNPIYQLPTFIDGQTGILPVVIGAAAQARVEFHVTRDGGATWQQVAQVSVGQTTTSAVPVSIVDAQHWIVLDPESQRLTHLSAQGATSIVPHLPAPAQLVSLDMVSPEVGWAVNTLNQCSRESESTSGATVQTLGQCAQETQLLRTDNGGQDWIALPLPPTGVTTLSATTAFNFQTQPNAQAGAAGGPSIQSVGGRTQTLIGQGFDKCDIPSLAALQDWSTNSPYKAVNLYIGGSARGCSNSALNANFLTTLSQQGWTFIPTWVGPQAACSGFPSRMSEDENTANAQGIAEADAALNTAAGLGLTLADRSGTVIYYNLEGYDTSNTKCHKAAKSFISGWVSRLRATGNQAGLYTLASAMSEFAGISNVPDAVWMAAWLLPPQYRAGATVWLPSYVDNTLWSGHQRLRQYAGDHDETWGATALTIDSNVIDGIVANIADHTPPTVRTQIVLLYANSPFRSFTVRLFGSDDLSGIAAYDLQYRIDSNPTWFDAITNTIQTDYYFVGDYGHTYTFRARARDRAGNQGQYPTSGDSSHAIPAECPVTPATGDSAEPDNTPAQAKPLVIGAPAQQHNFHAQADADWVTMTLQAGQWYLIATGNVGGLADTVISLYADPYATTPLAENDDAPWPSSLLVWKPSVSGTYYLKVWPYDPYDYGCVTAYSLRAAPARRIFFPVIGR